MTIEAGLSRFAEALGKTSPEEALCYLCEEKKQREAQSIKGEKAVLVDDPDLSALFGLYNDAGRILSVLTEKEDLKIIPNLDGNRLGFKVITTEGTYSEEKECLSHPEVPDLAFRLALAKAASRKVQPILLFDDFSSWLTPQMKLELRDLLTEWFSGGQIIMRVKK
jgi:hypothetical protein